MISIGTGNLPFRHANCPEEGKGGLLLTFGPFDDNPSKPSVLAIQSLVCCLLYSEPKVSARVGNDFVPRVWNVAFENQLITCGSDIDSKEPKLRGFSNSLNVIN